MFIVLVAGTLAAPLFLRPNPRLLPARTPADVGLPFEQVTFSPPDLPLVLRAWLMPLAGAKASVVFVHGGGEDNRSLPFGNGLELMRDLVGAGYQVLAPDLRNFGESDASPDGRISFGLHESDDVIGAVDFLETRGGSARVAVIGFSMGGSAAIYAAARDPRIAAVVSDSAFADSRAIVSGFVHAVIGIPPWLSSPLLWTADAIHGMKLGAGRAIDVVARIPPRPLLIVHDRRDSIVPVEHARRLAAAAPGSELWVTDVGQSEPSPFDTHIKSYMYAPEPYAARIVAFLDRALGTR